MFSTRFTELVGCTVPIQLAPMGQVTTPELAAAVIDSGGHAMFGMTGLPLPVVEAVLDRAADLGAAIAGANFLVPFADPEIVEVAAARVPVVDFFLGAPDRELVDLVHGAGALAAWQVVSTDEAEAAAAAGCDYVVAHGVEAGGRNPGGIGLLPLLSEVLERIDIPVVAAGGIGTGRGIAAALVAGADGVRLGTRFLAAAEAGTHPEYVAALVPARADDTILSDAFDALFPPDAAGSRVLRSAAEASAAGTSETIGEMQMGDERVPLPRAAPNPPLRDMTGEIGAMALYAGQSVGAVAGVQPAAELMAELIGDAERALDQIAERARVG